MTSASIMEMQKTGFMTQTNAPKAAPVNPSVQFSDAMDFASASQQDASAEGISGSEVKTHAEKSAAEHTGRKEIREVETTEPKADVSEEEVANEMEAKEEAIVKEIAEELGVSEEEVVEAMEVLGLSVMDLLVQGNMAALTAQLTGMQAVDVLTDENMFAQITELTATVQNELQEAADSLGMSMEQLQAALEEQLASGKEVQMSETPVMADRNAGEDAEAAFVMAESDATEVTEEVGKVQEAPKTDASLAESEIEVKSSTVTEQAKMTGEQSESRGDESAFMQTGSNVQVMQNNGNVVSEVPTEELFGGQMDMEQTKELINQISDYVRIHRSENVSSMEIQLHPVELGTVNLQVVAKDGAVSATLAVQDENIRAAMESQMVQLREALQEQGLKIDAVEVTVATHEFEQNLDQHGKDAEENAAKEKKNGRRILDLNEIGQEELDGDEISDADRLQIEMMRMGGNRLNYRI